MFWRLPKQLPISACVSCPAGQPASKSATSQLIVGVAIPSVQMNTRTWWESAYGCCCCVRLRFDWSVPLQHWNASRLAYCVTASSTPNYQSYTVTRACGACFLVRRQFDAVRKKKSYKKKRTRFVDQLERKKVEKEKSRKNGKCTHTWDFPPGVDVRGRRTMAFWWIPTKLFFRPFFFFIPSPTNSFHLPLPSVSHLWRLKKRHESICPSGRPLYRHAPRCWSLIPGYVILLLAFGMPSKLFWAKIKSLIQSSFSFL